MKKSKEILWLYSELPDLVARNIVDEAAAKRLQAHYGEVKRKSPMSLALTIFSVIGAVCIGLGIILVFAHNWDILTRGQRTALAFLPTILTLGLVGWVMRNKTLAAWRESAGVLNMLSVGATIALVSQIYQISGSISSFLLGWMLVTVPLVYILGSSMAAIFYIVGITVWGCYASGEGANPAWFWILIAAVVPYYRTRLRRGEKLLPAVLTAMLVSTLIIIGVSLHTAISGMWILLYSSYLTAVYLLAARGLDKPRIMLPDTLKRLGGFGVAVMAYILTFPWPWESVIDEHYRYYSASMSWPAGADYVILLVSSVMVVYIVYQAVLAKKDFESVAGGLPIMAALGFAIASTAGGEHWCAWIFSGYFLALGVIAIMTGVKERLLGRTNIGVFLVSLLIVTKFFEFNIDIITRGLLFIVVGVCFVAANMRLSAYMKKGAR